MFVVDKVKKKMGRCFLNKLYIEERLMNLQIGTTWGKDVRYYN